ncbi:MAG: hypothetical protein V3U17_07090 [Thermoplasmata archaeon]
METDRLNPWMEPDVDSILGRAMDALLTDRKQEKLSTPAERNKFAQELLAGIDTFNERHMVRIT